MVKMCFSVTGSSVMKTEQICLGSICIHFSFFKRSPGLCAVCVRAWWSSLSIACHPTWIHGYFLLIWAWHGILCVCVCVYFVEASSFGPIFMFILLYSSCEEGIYGDILPCKCQCLSLFVFVLAVWWYLMIDKSEMVVLLNLCHEKCVSKFQLANCIAVVKCCNASWYFIWLLIVVIYHIK